MSDADPNAGEVGPPGVSATARDLALAALRDRAGNVTAHLNRLLSAEQLSPADKALARELAMGVVRRRRTLDAMIAAFQQRPQNTPVRTRHILRLAAYQLVFLQRVPDFAAVNEAVEQVPARRSRLRGFVNAVLRGIARAASPLQVGKLPLAAEVVPVDVRAFRRFDRPIFADPAADAAGYLGAAFSLPDELAERWLRRFGGLRRTVAVAQHANARPPLVVRVNAARASVAEVLTKLAEDGVAAAPHANGLSVVLAEHVDLRRLAAFAEGLVQPQDAAATGVVVAADVRPGMRVLDLCAAPGTKTTHLAERMQDTGEIVAVDVSAEKLDRIQDNCRRMGLKIVRPLLAEHVAPLMERPFDLVLVDVPCSNTGVLARRAEARWRFSAANLAKLARDQRSLLRLGAEFVRSGGRLVYSTCSLEDEENRQAVRDVLRGEPTLRLLEQRSIRPTGAADPTRWLDGGYYAVLARS